MLVVIACFILSFKVSNTLREYQVLRGWQLPSQLRAAIATESHQNAKSCAARCSSSSFAARCRSFVHDEGAKRCIFYSKSVLIAGGEEEKSTQYDLYQFSKLNPVKVDSFLFCIACIITHANLYISGFMW